MWVKASKKKKLILIVGCAYVQRTQERNVHSFISSVQYVYAGSAGAYNLPLLHVLRPSY
jgi:hypothetical protein